jgi:hypothetical protein
MVVSVWLTSIKHKKKIIGNIYEPKVAPEDKVYLKRYYNHQPGSVTMDETLAKIKA